MKIPLTDLGSNTVRMSVYEAEGSRFRPLFSEKRMAGLASYVEEGLLSAEGINRACQVLKEFQWLLEQLHLPAMAVFATASLRNIGNTAEAVAVIRQRTGLEVDVISGELEARLDYDGAILDSGIQDGALFDIGGGSTEIVSVRQGAVCLAQSLPLGSLNLFERFVSGLWPGKKELEKLQRQICKQLDRTPLPSPSPSVCGIGGTARAVLKIANRRLNREEAHRFLTLEELEDTVQLLARRESEARRLVLRCCPDRVHTILPGALMMAELCRRLCVHQLYISKYGVREGYLCRKLLSSES